MLQAHRPEDLIGSERGEAIHLVAEHLCEIALGGQWQHHLPLQDDATVRPQRLLPSYRAIFLQNLRLTIMFQLPT